MAKGIYRIAVNGEHTADNYISAGSGVFGSALGAIGKGVGRVVGGAARGTSTAAESVPLNTRVALQGVTDRAVAELAADPSIARRLMSPGSYNHLVEGTRLAPASYGKAVERLSARIIEKDPALSSILSYQSRPFRSTPDFIGHEGYNMRSLDITTAGSTANHAARPYGSYTEIVTHPGLPSNLVFPR